MTLAEICRPVVWKGLRLARKILAAWCNVGDGPSRNEVADLCRESLSVLQWIGKFYWGWDRTGFENKQATSELVSLFTVFVTLSLGLIISQFEEFKDLPEQAKVDWASISIYFAGVFVILCCMVVILRAAEIYMGLKKHAYDRGTIYMARVLTICCPAFAFLVVGLVVVGASPGMAKFSHSKTLKLENPRTYEWGFDSSDGVVVTSYIDRDVYPSGVPQELIIKMKLEDSLRKEWEILRAEGRRLVRKNGKNVPEPAEFYLTKSDKLVSREGIFVDLEPGGKYFINVYLHRAVEEATTDVAIETLNTQQGLRIEALSKTE